MTQETWTAVDSYITDMLLPPDPILDAALQDSDAAGLPPHNVSPTQGKFLMLLALIHKANNILEIGTLGGYSTIWMARALPPNGRLITLESDPKHAEVARNNIARAGLNNVVEILVGKAVDTLPKLITENHNPFDLIFIDADKPSNPEYFSWALKLSRKGTVIIADNVIRDGTVIEANSDDPKVQGVRRFNEMLSSEPRVSATAIQTVGNKGYDGFAIALVTSD
jgi:predicted O-methyltransferase YrrM